MKSLLDQLPTLLGVVLGAVGAIVATNMTDRLRWRRDQLVRWDQRRLDAYMTFATTLKEITTIAFRLSATHRAGATDLPVDRSEGLELMARANVRRTTDWEALLLLGDEATVAAGRRWRDAVYAVSLLAQRETWDGAGWQPAVDLANVARDEFYVVARRGLRVGSGSVEQFTFLHR